MVVVILEAYATTTGEQLVPRVLEALAGNSVVGASTTAGHTAVWTAQGRGDCSHGGCFVAWQKHSACRSWWRALQARL